MKIRISRSVIAGIIIIIIAVGLIAYAILPKVEHHVQAKTYSASFTFYDVVSNKTSKPITSLTVKLYSLNYSSTLLAPNFANTSYVFYNLTKGSYNLIVYSPDNIVLYNETMSISENLTKSIVLSSQPLTIYVNLNGKTSILPYTIEIKSSVVNLTKQLVPSLPLQIQELPLGEYNISVILNNLTINSTSVNLNGKINNVTINTFLYNVTLRLFDQNKKLVANSLVYLIYNNRTVYNITSQSGIFQLNNVPPFNYSVKFSYKGINFTVPPYSIKVNKNSTNFNFTSYFTNATFNLAYQNRLPAKGLLVEISNNATGITNTNGTINFTYIPANVSIDVKVLRGGIIVLNQLLRLSYKANVFNFIIQNSTLDLKLVGVNNQPVSNVFIILQDSFNSSFILNLSKPIINFSLYPSNYLVQVYTYEIANEQTLLVYKSYLIINQTVSKTIILPVGYTLKVNTNNSSSVVLLYYVSNNYGDVLINQGQGSSVTFNNLVMGTYKIVLTINGEYENSTLITITNSTQQVYNVNIIIPKVKTTATLYPSFILSAVLTVLIATFIFLSYRDYKKKKSVKTEIEKKNEE